MPFSMFNKFKPFMSQSVLAMNMIACDDKIQPETEFAKIAKDNKLPVLGLETLDDELKAIDKIPLDSQVNDLKNVLLNFDSAKLEMQEMLSYYKKRNIDSALPVHQQNSMNGSSTEKELLIARNKNWLPVIVKAMNAKIKFLRCRRRASWWKLWRTEFVAKAGIQAYTGYVLKEKMASEKEFISLLKCAPEDHIQGM
jgi:uncharacterized protein YbaP (TraB family)